MNRRELLKTVCALPALLLAGHAEEAYTLVGAMDVERWWRERRNEQGYSVLLNCEDITDGCVWFDDREGVAIIQKRDESGNAYAARPPCGHDHRTHGCACWRWVDRVDTEHRYGRVRVVKS